MPRARSGFVAVAGQEGFVADTPEEASAWARRTHPDDDAAPVRSVRVGRGSRSDAVRG
ncbi:MAG: hypothetical protein K2X82_32690 [Gemmataceae bacterium]|nr:hypothetical protein [Gemmataceae bacterium]